MLLVKYYLALSPIHGLGIFAAEDIPAGTEIWRFTEGFDFKLSNEEFQELPEKTRNWIRHFGYYNTSEGGWVICVDEGRFVNHSISNNVSDKGNYTVARYDIKRGTELTCNYFEFDIGAVEKIEGESECRDSLL